MAYFEPESVAQFAPESVAHFGAEWVAQFDPEYAPAMQQSGGAKDYWWKSALQQLVAVMWK